MVDSKKHILVLEDEKMLLSAIEAKLNSSGFTTESFVSAVDALTYLSDPSHPLPEAIWLDYYMSDMNGLEFMQKVRSVERLKDIPVIVVSNSAAGDKINALTTLGVEKYLLKADYKLEEIIKELYDVINKNGAEEKNTNN